MPCTLALALYDHAWPLQVVGVWFYEEGEARKVAALLQQISVQKKALGHTARSSSLVGTEIFASPRQMS